MGDPLADPQGNALPNSQSQDKLANPQEPRPSDLNLAPWNCERRMSYARDQRHGEIEPIFRSGHAHAAAALMAHLHMEDRDDAAGHSSWLNRCTKALAQGKPSAE
jgi:hypothetical protein